MSRQRNASRVVAGYRRSLVWRARWRRTAEAVFDGCWLGVFDRADLAELDALFYASATEHVDGAPRAYHDPAHIRQGLQDWEHAAARHFKPGGTVIVTSAGAGREVLGLCLLGFDAVGFEPNHQMVDAARRHLLDPDRLRVSTRDYFPADAPAADAVVIGWGSYMLIPGRATRVQLLRDAADRLPEGGPLLVSFFVRPSTRYFSIVHRVGSLLRSLRSAEKLELGDALSPNFVHYFTREELEAEVREAGFLTVDYRAEPYGHLVALRCTDPTRSSIAP